MSDPKTTRRVALTLAALIALVWIAFWIRSNFLVREVGTIYAFTGEAFGAPYTVSITLQAKAPEPPADLDQRIKDIFGRVRMLMATDVPDSEIARFNASTSTEPIVLSPETAEVLACAFKVSDQTAGAYDITAGKSGMAKLEFNADSRTLRKLEPTVMINVGALLAGYGQDLVARTLDADGFTHYSIEFGSRSVEKVGNREYLHVLDGIARPLDGTDVATLSAADAGPLIDGRTGLETNNALVDVTVMHDDCLWAEAYARAILILGPDDGLLLAKLLKLPAVMTVQQPDGAMTKRVTPAYEERFGALTTG